MLKVFFVILKAKNILLPKPIKCFLKKEEKKEMEFTILIGKQSSALISPWQRSLSKSDRLRASKNV